MKSQTKLLISLIIFALVLVIAFVLYSALGDQFQQDQLVVQTTPEGSAPDSSTGPQPPAVPAPDFTVYDAGGNPHQLSDFFGKPIILNFWASWCGPCKREMPDFEKLYQETGSTVQFLMVNHTDGQRETVSSASGFIATRGYTFPVFYDTTLEASRVYGINAFPTTFFISADGVIKAWGQSAMTEATLRKGLSMIQGNVG